DFVAQVVAVEVGGLVALVFDPAQLVLASVVFKGTAGTVEQGSQQPALTEPTAGGHGGEAPGAGAAQGAQQEGFALVVQVVGHQQAMAGGQVALEGGVAELAGEILEAGAGGAVDGDALDDQPNAKGVAELLAEFFPGDGVGAEAVVDVDGGQRGLAGVLLLPGVGEAEQDAG